MCVCTVYKKVSVDMQNMIYIGTNVAQISL